MSLNQGYIIWPFPTIACVCLEGGGGTQYIDKRSPLSYLFKAQMPVKKSAKTGKNFNTFQRWGGNLLLGHNIYPWS